MLEKRLNDPPHLKVVAKEHVDTDRTNSFALGDAKEKYK